MGETNIKQTTNIRQTINIKQTISIKQILAVLLMLIFTTVPIQAKTTYTINPNGTLKLSNYKEVKMYINEKSLDKNYYAIMYDNKTYAPLNMFRTLKVDDIDAIDVNYEGDFNRPKIKLLFSSDEGDICNIIITNRTTKNKSDFCCYIESKQGGKKLKFPINNEQTFKIINKNGYNYIPLSVVRDVLGMEVNWDNKNKIVTITGKTNWRR